MRLLSDETAERLERTFAFVTGSHFVNYHYGAILSKSLKVLPVRSFDAQEIVPGLYLGDVYAAHNSKELQKRNITHVVTCTVGVAPPYPEHFRYMHLQILDCAAESIHEHFAETSAFISKAIESGGTVLVHCIRGVSRSATIVAAYLMTALKMSADEAVDKIREQRPIARPNYGFMIQLAMYGAKMKQGRLMDGPIMTFMDDPVNEDTVKDGADVITKTVTVSDRPPTTSPDDAEMEVYLAKANVETSLL